MEGINLRLRVGATLQRGPVVICAVGVVARGLLLGLLGLGAQGRFVFGIGDLARKHDVAEASLHGIKFGRRDNVFLAGRENARNFFLRVLNALRRRRMSGESLRNGSGTALIVYLDALEEGYIRVRIVARLIHVLNA